MRLGIKKKLSKRERLSIYAAISVIGIFTIMQLTVFPLIDKRNRLSRAFEAKTRALQEMRVFKSEYDTLNKQADLSKINFSNREKGFTLFSFLDRLSGQAGIKDHITYMKPSTATSKNGLYKLSQVELKLQTINLKQLTSYLYMIETSKNIVFVKRISITQTGKPEGFINVVMQVETFET